VYKAYDQILKEEVALKFMRVQEILKADKITSIFKEAEALKQLKHPNIIEFKDIFTLPYSNSVALVI
jgi:serine/threonine protein kinase